MAPVGTPNPFLSKLPPVLVERMKRERVSRAELSTRGHNLRIVRSMLEKLENQYPALRKSRPDA
jgi:hypothetical protein